MKFLKIIPLFYFFSFITTEIQCQVKEIKSISASELQARISSPDTFFVVNFWATWCKPCVEELPEFERFSKQNNKESIKVILVSLDFIEDVNQRLIPFLNDKKLSCEVLLLKDTNPNLFVPIIYEKWSGAIPATWIKRNKQVQFLEKKTTLEELEEIRKKMTE